MEMAAGARGRLFKWAVWSFLIFVAVFGALFGPAIFEDLTARNGTFQTTKRKFERLRNLALFRAPEQKRLLKAYDGPPKAPPAAPRTYYTPKH
jgi:hypothetical protein